MLLSNFLENIFKILKNYLVYLLSFILSKFLPVKVPPRQYSYPSIFLTRQYSFFFSIKNKEYWRGGTLTRGNIDGEMIKMKYFKINVLSQSQYMIDPIALRSSFRKFLVVITLSKRFQQFTYIYNPFLVEPKNLFLQVILVRPSKW